jgi:hypothetical protein
MSESVKDLASYRHCSEHIHRNWSRFLEQRKERLAQQERNGIAAEKVAENILEDLFTIVLDWTLADINNQVHYADLLLTRLGVKYLIVEAKRPGALAWNRRAVEAALEQARRYADEQKVKCIGVSDGFMLYAADLHGGGSKDRVFASLMDPEPAEDLWWLSVHGIYRQIPDDHMAAIRTLPEAAEEPSVISGPGDGALLHSKYKIPARCFGYVGMPTTPARGSCRTGWGMAALISSGCRKRFSASSRTTGAQRFRGYLQETFQTCWSDWLMRRRRSAKCLTNQRCLQRRTVNWLMFWSNWEDRMNWGFCGAATGIPKARPLCYPC